MTAPDRLKIDPDGLDEVVWTGVAHLERMDDGAAFLHLTAPEGQPHDGFGVWLTARKGKLDIRWEPRGKKAAAMARAAPNQTGRI